MNSELLGNLGPQATMNTESEMNRSRCIIISSRSIFLDIIIGAQKERIADIAQKKVSLMCNEVTRRNPHRQTTPRTIYPRIGQNRPNPECCQVVYPLSSDDQLLITSSPSAPSLTELATIGRLRAN